MNNFCFDEYESVSVVNVLKEYIDKKETIKNSDSTQTTIIIFT